MLNAFGSMSLLCKAMAIYVHYFTPLCSKSMGLSYGETPAHRLVIDIQAYHFNCDFKPQQGDHSEFFKLMRFILATACLAL